MNSNIVKTPLALFAIIFSSLAFAGDPIMIPALTIDGQTHTNVQIGTVTGSRVTILYDGGGERVAISNLPPDLQKRLGYDPEKARQIEATEAQQKAVRQEQANKNAAAIAKAKSKLGPAQKVRIVKISNEALLQLQIVPDNGPPSEVYVHNLPYTVLAFVRDLNATRASVASEKNVRYNDQAGGRSQAVFTRQAAKAETEEHLRELEGPYGNHAKACTTIMACPTDYYYSRSPLLRQWEFQGMAFAENAP